ncbi:MAG TPA: rhomboid family intramembrane serine protease [Anaerolineae bacterium]|nr:rhomboid family intramembrane serine protease [Anaerolineae bacterium]HQJ11151.1 rhomboid family intramembrane serine protease [Anaerolineae bacterium]HUM35977.1 rhomboid family intramembrane serine protease [Anaerolineae bacterium]
MIPIRDSIPGEHFPMVTVSLILVNVVVFLVEWLIGPAIEPLINTFGVTPVRIMTEWSNPLVLLTLFTAMYLHAGWAHLIGNMIYLGVFGNNVEDRMGHGRFFLFYTLSGLAAWAAQIAAAPNSTLPGIGASGAIAGVLGAYLLLFPRASVEVVVPLPLLFTTFDLPALVVLGGWFLVQFLNGLMTISVVTQTGGVAWWAHIGGFVAGMVLMPLFRRKRRVSVSPYDVSELWRDGR